MYVLLMIWFGYTAAAAAAFNLFEHSDRVLTCYFVSLIHPNIIRRTFDWRQSFPCTRT